MDEILAHPFFDTTEQQLVSPLPALMRGPGELDLILSYQSTQENFLFRLRRALNLLGITTADGTQVPPGAQLALSDFHSRSLALSRSRSFLVLVSGSHSCLSFLSLSFLSLFASSTD